MQHKCLTLCQPWATLVALGQKKIETRRWATSYRGPLLIHAAAGLGPVGGKSGLTALVDTEPFFRAFVQSGLALRSSDPEDIVDRLPRGAIVAECRLVACVEIDGAPTGFAVHGPADTQTWWRTRDEIAFGDYAPGRYAWLLADVRPLPKPIPAKGALGLWTWDGELPI